MSYELGVMACTVIPILYNIYSLQFSIWKIYKYIYSCSINYLNKIFVRFEVTVDLTHAHDFRDTDRVLDADRKRRLHFQYTVIFRRVRCVHRRVVPEFDRAIHADACQLRVVFGVQKHDDWRRMTRFPKLPGHLDVDEFFVPHQNITPLAARNHL